MDRSLVFLPGVVGTTTPQQIPQRWCWWLLDNPSSFPSRKVFPSRSMLRSTVILFCLLRGVVPSPRRFFSSRGSFQSLVPLHESSKVLDLDKFLDLILQHLTLLNGMSTVSLWYRHLRVQSAGWGLVTLLGGGIRLKLKASSRILPMSALKGVYLVNRYPRLSLCLSLWPAVGLLWRSFSFSFPSSPLASARHSFNFFSCINLATVCLSSFRLTTGFVHKLSANCLSRRVVIMWCMVMYELRFWMFIVILPNPSMNFLKDFPFS